MINRGSLPKAPRGHCVRAVAVSTQRRLFRARHFRLADSLKKIRRRAQNALSRRRPVSNRAAKIPVAQYGAMPMPQGCGARLFTLTGHFRSHFSVCSCSAGGAGLLPATVA